MNSNKLWDNNHMEYHKRIGKTLRKLHETPDRKVVIK